MGKERITVLAKAFDFFKTQVPGLIKKYAPLITSKVLGTSKSFYVWLVEKVFKVTWKKAEPLLEELMYRWDKSKLDKEQIKEYEEMKDKGATSEELKKKRLDMLNGNSSKL